MNRAELLPGSCLRCSTSVHSATGRTPFAETFVVKAFDWDVKLDLSKQLDDREVLNLPARMQMLHKETLSRVGRRRLWRRRFTTKVPRRDPMSPGIGCLVLTLRAQ